MLFFDEAIAEYDQSNMILVISLIMLIHYFYLALLLPKTSLSVSHELQKWSGFSFNILCIMHFQKFCIRSLSTCYYDFNSSSFLFNLFVFIFYIIVIDNNSRKPYLFDTSIELSTLINTKTHVLLKLSQNKFLLVVFIHIFLENNLLIQL